MQYIKYVIAYIALIIQFLYIGLLIMTLLGYIHLTFGNGEFIFWIIVVPCIYIYNKWKPFKLTGDLDLYIKKRWNTYLESQKSCPNCKKVVKADELTEKGKCKYCKDIETIELEEYYKKYPEELKEE